MEQTLKDLKETWGGAQPASRSKGPSPRRLAHPVAARADVPFGNAVEPQGDGAAFGGTLPTRSAPATHPSPHC